MEDGAQDRTLPAGKGVNGRGEGGAPGTDPGRGKWGAKRIVAEVGVARITVR
jgi:hypothetical protein